jgi:cytochrome c-type biogenesis protein CcmF
MLNFGQILLLMSFTLCGICGVFSIKKEYIKRPQQIYLYLNIANILALIAFIFLLGKYVTSDFSYVNVYENSNSLKPLFYKITGVWGNHEGSMLLFYLILSTYTFLFNNFSKYKNKSLALCIQSLIIFLFGFYIFFASDPFLQFGSNIPPEGVGLNPLLQDIGLAMHPPILYLGYAGFSLAYSIAITAIQNKEDEEDWILETKKWSLISWSFLSIGVALGSWWAYRELGWGGFWFWDPVENTSLLPWLFGTALIHSLLSSKKFGLVKNLSLILAVLSFVVGVFGFFIVRSGILSSVHSFASDPIRGIMMLIITLIILLFGFYHVFFKGLKSKTPPFELSIFSRHGLILSNTLISLTLAFTLFIAILYPVILEMFFEKKITVGEPYFNAVYIPISFLLLFFMVFTPYLKWPKERLMLALKKSSKSFLSSLLIVIILKSLFSENITARVFLGIFLGSWLIFSLGGLLLVRKVKKEKISKGFFAMAVAHIGFGLLVLSISVKTGFELEKHIVMSVGDKTEFANFKIKLTGYQIAKKYNYFLQSANFKISQNKETFKLYPENRIYMPKFTKTSESAIHYGLFSDFYISMGESIQNAENDYSFPVKIYYKPFISFIWLSCLIIALGGLIAILPSRN